MTSSNKVGHFQIEEMFTSFLLLIAIVSNLQDSLGSGYLLDGLFSDSKGSSSGFY